MEDRVGTARYQVLKSPFLELQDLGRWERVPPGLAKGHWEQRKGRACLISPCSCRVQSSVVFLVHLLIGVSEKQTPFSLIPSIILARWGRSVFNRAMLISTASVGRKVTKRRFHFDIIKLALNKYATCSQTRHASGLHLLHNS